MRRLGQYELLRKIGSGGMAEVWMGRRPAMGGASKAVAIKLLAHNIADDPTYRQMFIDEARLSMLLTNSNVVQVFDVGEVAGECFMVMEWVDGLNLADLTRNMLGKGEGLSIEMTAHVMGEVLRGLAYAHSIHHDGGVATIVHRDVSPQNVLCSVSGEVKLADFGVARLAREETSGLHVKGKLRYMAPEQLRGRSREPTVDLYAVGAMLHELLSGEKFRKGGDEADLYAMALSGEYPPLPSSVPAELTSLCKRLLEPDPTLRVQTAEQALELLARWPGYRNGAIELGRLVREYSGISGPRSGIVHFPPADSAAATVGSATAATASMVTSDKTRTAAGPEFAVVPVTGIETQGVPASSPTELITSRESGPLSAPVEPGTAQTHTWSGSNSAVVMREQGGSGPVGPSGPHPQASSLPRVVLVVSLLALVLGVVGLGVGLGWWGPKAGGAASPVASGDATKVDEQTGAKVDEGKADAGQGSAGTPTPVVETTSGAAADPAPTSGEPSGGTTTGAAATTDAADATSGDTTTSGDAKSDAADEPGETTPSRPKSGGTKPVDLTPARVDFIANDYSFVYIKVAGIETVIEPTKKLELKPGTHKVQLRTSTDGPWLSAGTLKIEAGKRYKVRMTKPAGVKVEVVG